MRNYSTSQQLLNNFPYAVMIVLGTAILVLGLQASAWGWIAGGVYLVYGLLGVLWIMVFLCPYCGSYGAQSCPCGYGRMAARLRPKKDVSCFREKFRKHIPVIVPLWLIPLLGGGIMAAYQFSWLLLCLMVVFALDAFVVLPLLSRKHGCAECPQRDNCVWMRSRRKTSASQQRRNPKR